MPSGGENKANRRRRPYWRQLPYAVLAAGIVVLAAVSYLLVIGVERDTRQIREEFRDNAPWYAGQFERELAAFMRALDDYQLGEESVGRTDLMQRLDVFWSRVEGAGHGPVGALYMSFPGAEELVWEAQRALRDIEPMVAGLARNDAITHGLIKTRLRNLPEAFHRISLAALRQQSAEITNLQARLEDAHGKLLIIFAGVLAGSGLLIALILLEMRQVNALRASLERRVAERTRDLREEVAERKHAAEALVVSEQRFKDFASSASDWFWESGPDLRFTYLSERFEAATGVPREQVLGRAHDKVGVPDERDELWLRHLDDLEKRRPFRDFRLVQMRVNGHKVYISLNGRPRFGADGEFLGYRGTGTNISEQVEAEKALRRSEERYRRLVDLSPDGILILVEERVVFANGAALRFLGAEDLDALVGCDVLDFVDPSFQKITRLRNRDAFERGREQPQMEMVFVGLDGRHFPVHCASTRLPREKGRAVLTVFRDISAIARAEAPPQRSS